MVHSEQAYNDALEASSILFSNNTADALHKIDEDTLLAIFEGVPQFEVSRQLIADQTKLADLLTDQAKVFPSKAEFRKMTQQGALSINKEKITDPAATASTDMLLNNKFILVQRGKKNYFLIKVID